MRLLLSPSLFVSQGDFRLDKMMVMCHSLKGSFDSLNLGRHNNPSTAFLSALFSPASVRRDSPTSASPATCVNPHGSLEEIRIGRAGLKAGVECSKYQSRHPPRASLVFLFSPVYNVSAFSGLQPSAPPEQCASILRTHSAAVRNAHILLHDVLVVDQHILDVRARRSPCSS